MSAYYTKIQSKIHMNIVKVKRKDIANPIDIYNAFNNFLLTLAPICQKPFLVPINHSKTF